MNHHISFYWCYLLLSLSSILNGQDRISISGYVRDSIENKPIIGASIQDPKGDIGVFTDDFGFFRVSLPSEVKKIKVSSIGYKTVFYDLQLGNENPIFIFLQPDTLLLSTVTIKSKRQQIPPPFQGTITLSQNKINDIPSIGGERDPIKAFSLYPGISGGREGQSSLLIRGGDRDQTQFLLDGAPVFNVGHYLDLLSVFNSDAIASATIIKGNPPPSYGGTLSGVLDIKSKHGNTEGWKGKGELGLISSKILIEGPIDKKKRISSLFAARASYLNVSSIGKKKKVLKFLDGNYNGFQFYDFFGKISYHPSGNQSFSISLLSSADQRETIEGLGSFISTLNEHRHTTSASLNYQWNINDNLVLTGNAFYGLSKTYNNNQNFTFDVFEEIPGFSIPTVVDTLSNDSYDGKTSLSTSGFKIKTIARVAPKHELIAGIHALYYQHHLLNYRSLTKISNFPKSSFEYQTPEITAEEMAIHFADKWQLNNQFEVIIGSRLTRYASKEHHFLNVAPRILLNYKMPKLSFSGSYGRTLQYHRLLLQNGMILNNQLPVWIPSSSSVPFSFADQISLEASQKISFLNTQITIGSFYKKMSGLIDKASSFDENFRWEEAIHIDGKGNAYGFEFSSNSKYKDLDLSLSYTLAWNERSFPTINEGNWYSHRFDNRHALRILFSYQINSALKAGLTWIYQSGDHFSFPTAKSDPNPLIGGFYIYSNRNAFELPPYHRLDLMVDYQKSLKNGNILGVRLDVYNAYSRKNPYYLRLTHKSVFDPIRNISREIPVLTIVSIFPILPSINIVYKFD